jgi:hypothetical protein
MVEDKLITTKTQVNTTENEVDIYIYYIEKSKKSISFFISNNEKVVEGVSFSQGDLGYTYENTSDIFVKNNYGDLTVTSTDSQNYSIDSNGQLIYIE